MFQNELPYDASTRSAWEHDATLGWAAYPVADSVRAGPRQLCPRPVFSWRRSICWEASALVRLASRVSPASRARVSR